MNEHQDTPICGVTYMMRFAHFCIQGLNSKLAANLAASFRVTWQPFYVPNGGTFFHSTWGHIWTSRDFYGSP